MISQQGHWLWHHTDSLCSHGATWLVRRLINNARASWHDGLRQRIPVFHCPDAIRLSVILSVRSHSNQFLLICIGAARRSGRQDAVDRSCWYKMRTCGPADRQRYNLRTKNLWTVTADHGIKCGPQFADQTGVEVLNDRLFWCLMRLLSAYSMYRL